MTRVTWIDGLKGLSALVVVMSHFCAAFKYACPAIYTIRETPVIGLLVNGNLAVYVFIMLSAMLMYGRILRGLSDLSKIGSIIRKRYLRLTLPIAVVFFIAFGMKTLGLFYHSVLGEKYNFDWLQIDRMEYSTFLQGIFLSALGNSCGWFNVMWMMKYVFIGSLFALCLGLGVRDERMPKRIGYILLLSILSYFIDFYYCAVFAGCLLYEIILYLRSNKSIQKEAKILSFITMGGQYSSESIGSQQT